MTTQTTNIIVLGGGYSGVMAALRLASRTKRFDTSITLVNTLEHFVERPRLHEHATGVVLPNRPIAHILRGSKAYFLHGCVTNLNLAQRCVHVQTTNGEQQLAYDYLVIALGSRVDRYSIPGVHAYAFTLDPYGDLTSEALKSKLTTYGQNPFRVVVVGGGATGVEAATQVKGSYPHSQVALVTQGEVGAFKGARVQGYISQALREQVIAIYENARVNRVEQDRVVLDSDQILADIIIWA
ncbi:MAG TPA: FAD-dependent oxidoreductase, partial [Anaerolineae bacterium]|nr:FAD-dependent oxidoreductase [Anaerolineae bacterium]